MERCLNGGPGEIEIVVKMPFTRTRTKRPRGALLYLGIELRFVVRRIAGRLGNWACGLGGAIVEIPASTNFDPNVEP